jgi:NAD(P)H-hydrate repair Nnr-like enzyme with NAD(P)H-hydrate epimerase domain
MEWRVWSLIVDAIFGTSRESAFRDSYRWIQNDIKAKLSSTID